MEFYRLLQNSFDDRILTDVFVMLRNIKRKLGKAVFADLSRFAFVRHLRGVLAPFCNDRINIHESVFANGVRG